MSIERIIEFAAALPAPPKEEKKKGGHRLLIGAAIAAPAIPLARASLSFAASAYRPALAAQVRKVSPRLAGKIHHPGKQIFDYIEGSQQALNKGVTGKIAGHIIQNPKSRVGKILVPHKVARSHYSSFRAGPKEAFTSMLEEVGSNYGGKVSSGKNPPAVRAAGQRKLDSYMDEMGHALTDFDNLIQTKGFNEREALRHVTSDQAHANLMRKLVPKTSWAPRYAQVTGTLAAPPLIAGAAVASTRKKYNEKKAR
jgi:hypothetical protein